MVLLFKSVVFRGEFEGIGLDELGLAFRDVFEQVGGHFAFVSVSFLVFVLCLIVIMSRGWIYAIRMLNP
jgi:hypothetical protein